MAMQLASMVHGSGREREVHDHRRMQHHQQPHQQHQQRQSPQQHHLQAPQQQPQHQHQQPSYYPQQPQQRPYGSPATASASPYPVSNGAVDYQYQRPPQSPPSPPVEEQKPSLPSISSLLTIAGSERAPSESAGQSPRSQQHPSPQIRPDQHRGPTGAPQHQNSSHQPENPSPQVSHSFGPSSVVSNPKMTLPPTPPMHPDSAVDGNQSPSATSTHSTTPYYLGQSLNNMEPHQQRQHISTAPPTNRYSNPTQPSTAPYNTSPYAQSPYASSPGAASAGSYYSPEPHYSNVGMYGQRPLPSTFEPSAMPLPVPTPSGTGSNLWQHHHYISASSQAAFPQSQDRYICSTCNKAFSRPSSLRIHSHSHTGEKPYKCPQPGCGKAFSVRSNMKRHERGCHASANATTTKT